MAIIHLAAECFPFAKIGGLADVVSALPKYQKKNGEQVKVVIPYYNLPSIKTKTLKTIFQDNLLFNNIEYTFKIHIISKEQEPEVFAIDIPELLFKEYVYSSEDTLRFLAFQIAFLQWLITWENKPEIIHLHDHHTGLIPFMMTQSYQFQDLKNIPTVFTIHNAQYQGWFSHELVHLIPAFNFEKVGMLDWDGVINPMAAAIKSAWKITTVSPTYMKELQQHANGLEKLLVYESGKCTGILNGIDTEVWNPETDKNLIKNYKITNLITGKKTNKNQLCTKYTLNKEKPLIVFIGRFVHDKGCDLFANLFSKYLEEWSANIMILGSGDTTIENDLKELNEKHKGKFYYESGYNEPLAHLMYAGADFLLMPSRVEPCGLNQMYSLRYGTIPIVNKVGGLKDTVVDLTQENGFGICIEECTIPTLKEAIERAIQLYQDPKKYRKINKQIMKIDHDWSTSANKYKQLYKSLTN